MRESLIALVPQTPWRLLTSRKPAERTGATASGFGPVE
jgi:hypothetical protein